MGVGWCNGFSVCSNHFNQFNNVHNNGSCGRWGRSTVTVSFYAGQRTQQQIDNRNVKIPNGTRPYRVVTEKTLTRPRGIINYHRLMSSS